ncbi:MAG: permease [Deltaproteobacteria bacterium]|nr:permease [Deltaproteobacteria bacterium]MBW2051469.1 permease [Deltaproteobacteria bacterium]MBW2140579.1 permease [Deltaproteobacteria bacterium]MBW2323263.1 permease [Deltaproteobacteria bacterium]
MNSAKGQERGKKVNVTLLIMLVLVCVLIVTAYIKDPSLPVEGFKAGGKLFLDILPTLVIAFIAAGMITQVLPRELMTRWLGEESGISGLLIATLAGAVTPGGPFVQFPIVAALLKAGAGVAPLMAYISAWSLLGVNRFLVYEVPLLGWKLALSRITVSLIFPVIIGLMTRFIWARL